MPSTSAATLQPPPDTSSAVPDARAASLCEWVRRQRPDARLSPLAGDASFRRYFRVRFGREKMESLVAMDAPPPNENVARFAAVREFMGDRVAVPTIHSADFEKGFALLQDFGDNTLARALSAKTPPAESLYHSAVRALIRLQAPPFPRDFPPYDEPALRKETALFAEWFCRRALSRPLSGAARTVFDRADSFFAAHMTQAPMCVVHRDYHSRNLMILPDNNADGFRPGALDFQDAVLGPAAYDLASLARDAYVPPDERRCEMILDFYWSAMRESGLRPAASRAALRRDFDITSAQRGLKVLGIFCRLAIRDGKMDYLPFLSAVHANASSACAEVSELADLGRLLADIPPPDAEKILEAA